MIVSRLLLGLCILGQIHWIAAQSAAQPTWPNVRISEILALNDSGLADADGQRSDWIELHNLEGSPVQLEGFFLTDDEDDLQKWSFPSVLLDSDGYLILFASGKDRRQVGETLHTNFRLSQEGEYLALVAPDGESIVDAFSPRFPPQFSDVSYGLNPDSMAVYFPFPSPGQPNSAGSIQPGPHLSGLTHWPSLTPQNIAGEPLAIEVQAQPTEHAIHQVRLYYRYRFNAEQMILMSDEGNAPDATALDRIFTAWIPTDLVSPGEIIRWRVEATDRQGNLQRLPSQDDLTDGPKYHGVMVPKEIPSLLPVLHWFIEQPQLAASRDGTRAGFSYLNRFYDNVQIDLHGQSTAGSAFPKKSHDIDFNRGERFIWSDEAPVLKDVNLLTNWADKTKMRHILAYEIFRESGVPAHFAFPVRVEQNGRFHGIYDLVEDGDDVYLERAGLNPEGALYKMYNNMENIRLDTIQGVEKKTRTNESHADLAQLLTGIHAPGSRLLQYVHDHIDIPQCVNFIAANSVTSNTDLHAKNYYLYRDTTGTGEWFFLPWDLDLSFGRQWNGTDTYFDDRIFVDRPIVHGRGNFMVRVLTDIPEIRAMVLRRIRTLNDRFLQPTDTPLEARYMERRIAYWLELMDPQEREPTDADLDYRQWRTWGNGNTMREETQRLLEEYLPGRRDFVYNRQTQGNGGEIPPPQQSRVKIEFGEVEFNPSTGNQDEEYIQIINSAAVAVDLSDWRLRGGVEFDFEPGTVIPSNGSLWLSPNVSAFRNRSVSPHGGEGLFVRGNYKGQISARGETLEIRDGEDRVVALTNTPSVPTDLQRFLRLSEVHYAPLPPTDEELTQRPLMEASDFEFIEFTNIGDIPLSMDGAVLNGGVEFTFPANSRLEPGSVLVVAGNLEAFALRQGSNVHPIGNFEGNLNNAGETIGLREASGENVLEFSYDGEWFEAQIEQGYSLSVIEASEASFDIIHQDQWTVSDRIHGTPGLLNRSNGTSYQDWIQEMFDPSDWSPINLTEPDQDPDHDGRVNLVEYALGTNPKSADPPLILQPTLLRQSPELLFLTWSLGIRRESSDVEFLVERSEDLVEWRPASIQQSSTSDSTTGGRVLHFAAVHDSTKSASAFYRVRIRLR